MKKLLVLNDFSIYPIEHGGKVRIFNIYCGLSKYFDITYLCFTKNSSESVRVINSHFREVSIPFNFFQRYFLNLFKKKRHIDGNDIITLVIGNINKRMRQVINEKVKNTDVLVLIHPYMNPLICNRNLNIPIIHESLNVEYELKKSFYPDNITSKILLNILRKHEKMVLTRSKIIFAVSQEDAEALSKIYNIDMKKIYLAPNGVDIDQYPDIYPPISRKKITYSPLIIFLGSGHPPNVTAALQILNQIAPKTPDCSFLICGSVCWAIANELRGPNVGLAYLVSDDEKVELFLSADVAINPMMTGSGTNLKMLDYLAAGLPVITTPVGARGLHLINRENVIISDINQFPVEINNVLNNPDLSEKLSKNGINFVKENYSWNLIAEKMSTYIQNIV
jgi:glycosyltransferase involved in cell wall biosynthesis